MSSLYKRKSDGRWVCAIEAGKDRNGKRKRIPIYADANLTEEQAAKSIKSQRIEIEYQLEHNIYRDPGNATIKDLIKEYNEHCENDPDLATTTKELYKMYEKKHICSEEGGIGHLRIGDIIPTSIEKFYQSKSSLKNGKAKLSSNTVLKLHSFLHSAFEFAKRNKLVFENPIDAVKRPKKTTFKPRVPTDYEFFLLLESSISTFDEVAILLAGGLSLCRGEICGVKWSDVDWKNYTITIEETHVRFNKYTRKDPKAEARKRTISVPAFIMETLRSYQSTLKVVGVYICDYKPDAYGKHFVNFVGKVGLKNGLDMNGITLHKLRHFNATLMHQLNIPDKVGAGRTGHSRLATYQEIYVHTSKTADKIASDKINGFLVNKGT